MAAMYNNSHRWKHRLDRHHHDRHRHHHDRHRHHHHHHHSQASWWSAVITTEAPVCGCLLLTGKHCDREISKTSNILDLPRKEPQKPSNIQDLSRQGNSLEIFGPRRDLPKWEWLSALSQVSIIALNIFISIIFWCQFLNQSCLQLSGAQVAASDGICW